MPHTIEERDWDLLIRRIRDGKCTPFIGSGACSGVTPFGAVVAADWAERYSYPLADCKDLARVAQYLAVQKDAMFPKEAFLKEYIEKASPPDFEDPDEPHAALASLPLPLYITTNYDDFMYQALRARGKDPRRDYCRWNSRLQETPSVLDSGFEPSEANPVVFHLHGCSGHERAAESIVLTEDDYLDFLVNVSREHGLSSSPVLPARVAAALTGSSLLFIGYRLADWSFRVLFRGLIAAMERTLRRLSVTVQLLPDLRVDDKETRECAERYLSAYFARDEIKVYLGTASEFCHELNERRDG